MEPQVNARTNVPRRKILVFAAGCLISQARLLPAGYCRYLLFTDRARRVLVLAQEEARLLNHGFIGTEHLLLGLIDEGEGVAARALATGRLLGISTRESGAHGLATIVPGRRPNPPQW